MYIATRKNLFSITKYHTLTYNYIYFLIDFGVKMAEGEEMAQQVIMALICSQYGAPSIYCNKYG